MAMPSFNILRCFSEQSERSQYVCEGDVCYLRNTKESQASKSKKNDQKQSIRIPFYRVSTRKAWDVNMLNTLISAIYVSGVRAFDAFDLL